MTCPQIGNYGVSSEDTESVCPRVSGFVMRDESPVASNWRADATLRDYLVEHGIVAIAGIDTRALTRLLRSAGVMRGVIATDVTDPEGLVAEARCAPTIEGSDLVRSVTCSEPFEWDPSSDQSPEEFRVKPDRPNGPPFQIAAENFGMKRNILRRFDETGERVQI